MSRRFGPALAVAGAAVALTAAVGGRFTALGIGPWYDGLAKPAWTPPGSVIGGTTTSLPASSWRAPRAANTAVVPPFTPSAKPPPIASANSFSNACSSGPP